MRKKVLLVDNHQILKLSLEQLFKIEKNFRLSSFCKSIAEVKEAMLKFKPDIAIIDICLDDENGIDICKYITENFKKTKVLIFTTFEDDDFVIDAIQAGASGYLLKDIDSKELLHALNLIIKGVNLFDIKLSKSVKEILIKDFGFAVGI